MKHIALLTALAMTTLPLQALGFERIKSEADYVKHIVGNKYCNKTGCWTARKNGKMTGKFGSDRFRANWAWRKGFSCRTGTLGGKDIGTDCQVVEVSGNQIRVTRQQGKGRKTIYTAN